MITHGEIEPNTYGLAVPVHRRAAVAADLYQPHLASRGCGHARQGHGVKAAEQLSDHPELREGTAPMTSPGAMGTTLSWDHETDVVVLGSGAAGLTAALTAAANGASVEVYEKAATVGGTSAVSGGIVWIPAHNRMPARS